MSFAVGYCTKCKEWKSQPVKERCADCTTILIEHLGDPPRGMTDEEAADKQGETDRVTFLGAAAKVLRDSLDSSPMFKDCVVVVISVVPDGENGDILNMVSNAGPKTVPIILAAAYQKSLTSKSHPMAKPN